MKDRDLYTNLFHIALIALIGTFVFDLLYTHFFVFENYPTILGYFLAVKAIPAFVILSIAFILFQKDYFFAWFVGLPIAITVHATLVQIYYGIFCVPLRGGSAACLSMTESLRGIPQHFFDFMLAWIIVTLVFRKWLVRVD